MKTPTGVGMAARHHDIKVPKDTKPGAGYTSIQHTLRDRGEHDPGSGSTLVALTQRGLLTETPNHCNTVKGGSRRTWVRGRGTQLGEHEPAQSHRRDIKP